MEVAGDWPEWHRDALCAEPKYNPDWWFAERGRAMTNAKNVCARCAARVECLGWALDFAGPLPGIWGGTSTSERKLLKAGGATGDRVREGGAAPVRVAGVPAA